jgi:hypothetical protein
MYHLEPIDDAQHSRLIQQLQRIMQLDRESARLLTELRAKTSPLWPSRPADPAIA